MKINNKGYASTIIMFSILTLFLISMLMLVKTMNNSSSLNKQITDKVVDNIDYDASGSVQDKLKILDSRIDNIENSMLDKMYPVGSIYMTTTYSTTEEVTNAIGGEWEVYASGRTLVSAGTYTKDDGNAVIYNAGEKGGNVSTTLTSSNIPSLSVTGTTNSTGSGYSIQNTCTNRTTSTNGNHTHEFNTGGLAMVINANSWYTGYGDQTHGFAGTLSGWWSNNNRNVSGIKAAGNHTHTVADCYANSISGVGAHTHTFTGNYTNNNVKDISVQNPYIVVYMYRRIN